jgi:hypothetical protein
MARRLLIVPTVMLAALISLVGCGSMSIPLINSGPAQPAAGDLYTKVPASMQAPVKEASFDLQQAQSNLRLADKKVTLADLSKDVGLLEKKHADASKKLAEIHVQKAQVVVERKRAEAIDNANLGDKASNIKTIADLKTKELSIESEAIKTKAEMDTLALQIRELNKKVAAQTQLVASHK